MRPALLPVILAIVAVGAQAQPVPVHIVGPVIVVPPPVIDGPRPPVLLVPAPPVETGKPAALTTCDAGGCWDSEGRRLDRSGPILVGPRGGCTVQAGVVHCP
jgi:hypothetical protein